MQTLIHGFTNIAKEHQIKLGWSQ